MGEVNSNYFYKTPEELMGIAIGSPISMDSVAPPPPGQPEQAPPAGGAQPPMIKSAVPPPPPPTGLQQPGRVGPSADAAPPPINAPTAGLPQQATNIPQDPRRGALEQKIAGVSQPLDRNDKKYQPKWWEKLGAVLAAGAYGAGGGRDSSFGANLGMQVRQGRYDEAEADRTKSLKGYETELGNVEKDENTRHQQRLENQSQYRMDLEDKRMSMQDADRDEQRKQRQEEITRTYQRVAEDGKIHTYDETRAGKTIDRGVAGKDANLDETKRHNQAMEGIDRDRLNKEGSTKSKMGTPEQFKQAGKDKEMALSKLSQQVQEMKAGVVIPGHETNSPEERDALRQIDDFRIQEEQRIEHGYGDAINTLGGTYQGPPVGGPDGYHWSSAFRSNVGGKQPPETGEAGATVEAGKAGKAGKPSNSGAPANSGNIDKSAASEPRQGERVTVYDKNGKGFTVPQSQVELAKSKGYTTEKISGKKKR